MNAFRRLVPPLAAMAVLVGCTDQINGPDSALPPTPAPGAATRQLGVLEITITGIGTVEMSASARFPDPGARGPSLALIPVPASGTIQLTNLSNGSFTHGVRGAGGVRYMQTTFGVRNADAAGVAYDTGRQNLTFLAASTTQSLDETPVRAMRRFDGSEIAQVSLASQILPTGPVHLDGEGRVASSFPDALQALTEGEAASFTAPAGVTSIFPYGFVVRRAALATNRALPAGPGPDQFEGLVTFAFRIPLQPTAADDVRSITLTFVPVDDTELRITQSLEEQTPSATAAFLVRAAVLGAAPRVLPGATTPGQLICTVRTAGTAHAPTAYLVNGGGCV